MKIAGVICALILGLFFGTTALASRQHGHEEERQGGSDKHQGNDHQKEHGRSSAQQRSDRHQAKGTQQRHEERPREQQRADQNRSEREQSHRQANAPQHARAANRHEAHSRPRDVWQGHRAQNWRREHRSWRERGGYRGYRIPEDRFRAHFGRGHWFRVYRYPIIVVDGFPRFQYEGFWFTLVDPWPESWANNWYETDDVYIDHVNDGYYMFNRRHPGVAIAVNVSF